MTSRTQTPVSPKHLAAARSPRSPDPDPEAVVGLLRQAADLAGTELAAQPEHLADASVARRSLAGAWDNTLDVLASAACQPPSTEQFLGIVELLRGLKAVDDDLVRRDIEQRDAQFHKVRDGLHALSEIDSTAKLVTLVPGVVCSLGFDRAIISRVEESLWIPEHVTVDRDPAWADEILEVGRAAQLMLTSPLPETEILRRRVSLVVENVQHREAVHKPIAEASGSRSYAASPIVVGGQVVGFLHGDRYYQQRALDETDRQVLATFAEGLSQVMARTLMLDQIGAVRSSLADVASRLPASDGLGSWGSGLPGGRVPDDADEARPRPREMTPSLAVQRADLTRRELEVLRHMADGDTNARTARRLVISEGTVKSHVKHILRKLGAANRAEAVSLWWRMEREGRSGHSA